MAMMLLPVSVRDGFTVPARPFPMTKSVGRL